ncbi:acetyl-CoA synthetase-like protein [Schizophyllum commune H4-8]|uniref:acetyl-CoA synthetase-like protein n=1 Tax=Schizophyllum commune (strain H4-8 / FGSC 9210) TaxID=578458 RepID=UPI0021601E02|nr:acetyl-CoA synthetase-like protein [Schizophyllum commune H4-8]KAI5885509.1 acetyl-CoA synthetase-like protein [Schizophyllum commune H4-8]
MFVPHRLSLRSVPIRVSGSARANARLHKSIHARHLQLSAVEGPLEPPLDYRTLPIYFQQEILAKHSTRPALVCRQERPRAHAGPPSPNLGVSAHLAWDFEEFDRHIKALARGLLELGVKPGERVAVIMGNNSAYAMLQWACASIGAILVTINPAYRINELIQTLSAVGVKHLICVPRIRSSAYLALLADAAPGIRNSPPGEISDPKLPELRNIFVMDNGNEYRTEVEKLEIRSLVDWREILLWREDTREEKARRVLEGSMGKDDVINLQFTSGTTGLPKAVSLTHHNLLNNGVSVGQCMRLTDKDILCNVPPLFHCFGLVLGNLAAWTHGASIVYPSPVFDPPAIVDAVIEESCTALHGVPTHFLGVLSEVDKRRHAGERVDLSYLRTGIAAGSSIPIDLMKRLIEHMNLRELTNAYGMTETSPVSFQTVPEDPIIKRVETVGRVQPHVKAKIVDGDGNVVPVGSAGQLLVAGYLLQKGYWNDDAQTQAVMKEDDNGTLWMHTGDEGIMDEDGYLRIVGRIKDIIIRGGENLFPVQIENALTDHPGIREAAAIAVPDMKYGEVVGTWIAREPGTDVSRAEVRRAVADAMNPQNAPAWVWFLGEEGVMDELPKTASGKVQKHVLRSWSKPLVEKKVGQV